METWVVIFDSFSTLGFVLALIFVLRIGKNKIGSTSRLFLGFSVSLYVLVGISNILEHLHITEYFDSYEDYMEILFVPFFMFFLFSLYMEQQFQKQQEVEESVRASEEKFAKAFHSNPDAITVSTLEDGRLVEINSGFEKVFGYHREEAIGKSTLDLNLYADPADRQRFVDMLREHGHVRGFELPGRHKSGAELICLLSAELIEIDQKPHLLTTTHDITQRKQIENALRQANLVVENSPAILFRWKAATGWPVDLVSQNVIQFGYTPDELLSGNTNFVSIVHPDDLERVTREVQSYTVNHTDRFEQEYRIITKNGKVRWVDDRTVVERNNIGQVTHYQGIIIDITQRKQFQEALFEEKERAQVTLDSIGDAVITTDQYGLINYLNPVAETLTGWKMEDAKDQPLSQVFQIINEKSRKPIVDPVERCLQEGKIIGLANHTILLRRDGKEFAIDDSAAPIRNRAGQIIGVVLVFHDVTEARSLQRQMAYDATHDTLTGLVNRREFEDRLQRSLESAGKRELQHVLCYLDLDQFKVVNDTVGHIAGDELLKQVSRLLSGLFRHRDTLARLGGDEFGLLLENCPIEKAIEAANKIINQLSSHQFTWEGQSFQVGVSIGVVSISSHTQSIAQAMSEADVACYIAKDLGRGRFHIYEAEDSETAQRHGEILRAVQLRDAVEKDLFELYCQPIKSLLGSNPHVEYYEMLLRLKDDNDQIILPDTFIPSAERYGMMASIDRWVIRTALSTLANKLSHRDIRLSINLSGNSLNDDSLLEYVQAQFNEFLIPPEWVCFEITETAAIQNLSKAQHFVSAIRQLGAKIALDDFGSGLSSFRYLKTLSIDFLKIDGSFVRDMLESQNDRAMVAAIHQVGHTMGIYTIAEHVERKEIIAPLKEMGVDYAQGYALGYPKPFDEI